MTSGASQAKPAQDGLLFPIEPEHEKPLPVEKPAPEVLLLPSHDEAKTLCTLAAQIKALAPWQWIEETDVFGVEDPDTGEIGFVSVMGHVGEYEAVAVYPGAEGIYAFIDFQCDLSATPDRLLEIPQVQLSFSEAKFLEKRDRELLKSVGLKFRGTRPQFRSYRPGFLPWFITLEEARLLIHALSQTLEMAKRFAGESVAFPTGGDDKTEPFLVRVARKDDSSLKEDHSKKEVTEPREQSSPSDIRVASRSTPNPPNPTPSSSDFAWEDQIKHIPRPQAHPVTISIDVNLLQDLKTLPLSTLQLEADLFIGPARIGKPNERPMTLYMLMLADRHSGLIFGFEALSAENSLNTMYAAVPEKVAELLWQSKVLPKQIIVRSVLLLDLLEPLERELQIQLRSANNLPAIDRAARSMTNWLSTGKM
ncbi:MAG: hypothetical protein AABN95_07460 [Acidobacteriota bacterium]